MLAETPDEGRRVLGNVASFGAFLFSPLFMLLLNRALGPAGYGEWWWTFGVVEAASLIGIFGTDLYVRREVPRLVAEGRDPVEAIGTGVAIVIFGGVVFGAVQVSTAGALATTQRDPGLRLFLLVLAAQPLLWNLTNLLAAALQSVHVLAPVAIFRGLVVPLAQAGLLYLAWQTQLSTTTALVFLLGVSVFALGGVVVIYARQFSLATTMKQALRPKQTRSALRFGVVLLVPLLMFTIGGKMELYVLGRYADPATVGAYAACLTLAATLPAVRSLFDPIAQHQIGALLGRSDADLSASIARMTRLLAFALAPALVLLVAIGEPMLHLFLGRDVPFATIPLVVLCAGQLIGSLAIGSWLVPMASRGRALSAIALAMFIVKLGALLALVPSLGLLGAAIATSAGTVIAQQGQAILGARALGQHPQQRSVLPIVAATAILAVAARLTYEAILTRLSEGVSAALTGVLALTAVLVWMHRTLERSELAGLRRMLRMPTRGE